MYPQHVLDLLDKQSLTIREFVFLAKHINTFFGVVFIKKSDGQLRRMLCRTGVTKGVKGILPPGHRDAEDARCNVLTVYDIHAESYYDTKGAFRRINLEQIVSVSICGNKYSYSNSSSMLEKQI